MDIYETCPVLENEHFLIRLLEEKDVDDLWCVYGDKFALPYFNSDNCNGHNFYCERREWMESAIKFWLIEYYENRAFVRFSIVDKKDDKVIGSIEMFRRKSEDFYNDCGLLRIDVRRDYENSQSLYYILSLIVVPFYTWFECSTIITKAPLYAVDRIEALKQMDFERSSEPLVSPQQKVYYYDYWIRKNNNAQCDSSKISSQKKQLKENKALIDSLVGEYDQALTELAKE